MIWFGFLGAAAAWSVQQVVGYALMATACAPHGQPELTSGASAARGAALVVAVAALVVAMLALSTARRLFIQSLDSPTAGFAGAAAVSDRAGVSRYLAFGGLLLGLLFALGIVFNAIALLAEPICSV